MRLSSGPDRERASSKVGKRNYQKAAQRATEAISHRGRSAHRTWCSGYFRYECLLSIPLTGYLGVSSSKEGVVLFGLPLLAWASSNKDLSEAFFFAHMLIAEVLMVLVVIHVLGAQAPSGRQCPRIPANVVFISMARMRGLRVVAEGRANELQAN
jgi:hypothetical protein